MQTKVLQVHKIQWIWTWKLRVISGSIWRLKLLPFAAQFFGTIWGLRAFLLYRLWINVKGDLTRCPLRLDPVVTSTLVHRPPMYRPIMLCCPAIILVSVSVFFVSSISGMYMSSTFPCLSFPMFTSFFCLGSYQVMVYRPSWWPTFPASSSASSLGPPWWRCSSFSVSWQLWEK